MTLDQRWFREVSFLKAFIRVFGLWRTDARERLTGLPAVLILDFAAELRG